MVKNPPIKAGDTGPIPELGRSPREGNGTNSSILAWEMPWTEGPGGLQFMGLQRVVPDLVTKQQQQCERKIVKKKKSPDNSGSRISCLTLSPFWPHCAACRILVSQPGIEPLAVKA